MDNPGYGYVQELTASVGVSDLGAAIEWYQSVLGFSLLYRMDDIGWCEMATAMPGVNIGLSQLESVGKGGGATVVFGVDDIEGAKAHLDSLGVRQDGGIQVIEAMVKLITFFDPDGNTLMFSQNLTTANP